MNFTQVDEHELLPTPYYFCDNGTLYCTSGYGWFFFIFKKNLQKCVLIVLSVLESTGRLASWQKTYLAIEIWEYDQYHQKYQQFYKEFQWNKTECTWDYGSGGIGPCDYLPLTGTNSYTARILFTMPKRRYDSRQDPLLIVWYDILGIPYGVRPKLLFQYKNLTFIEVHSGNPFSFSDLLTTGSFKIPFYSMISLLIMFILLSIAGVIKGKKGRAITKADYIIDTRNLRSVFQNLPETVVVEEKYLKSRSKFKFYKHGPYLCIVLLGRLAYMFVFTLTFFYLVFESVNKQHFEVLGQYHKFANNRDDQLWNLSAEIETYYNSYVDFIFTYLNNLTITITIKLKAAYSNKTNVRLAYDNFQMQEPLRRFKGLNLTGADNMYAAGTTACDTNPLNGARMLNYDELCIYSNSSVNETCYDSKYYNRSWANFSDLQTALVENCLHTSDCVGWTWIDPTSSSSTGHFAVFSQFSTPQFTNDTSGICYLIASFVHYIFIIL
ncbi:hypothetical protein RFI_10688 [Reticulomyxa filosa]|uniref:Uncharacterized protein n=1 Tax=Reticulomyxa filosa TaxID=46433 RepID=X6NKM0_RETFI|nr:hypothetical protein RFI_10688 [Reticulomyxa filosa]|eukprot:ETO26448.1 hypothetical protein RFI_10688 [Reticulomyxa filosa]